MLKATQPFSSAAKTPSPHPTFFLPCRFVVREGEAALLAGSHYPAFEENFKKRKGFLCCVAKSESTPALLAVLGHHCPRALEPRSGALLPGAQGGTHLCVCIQSSRKRRVATAQGRGRLLSPPRSMLQVGPKVFLSREAPRGRQQGLGKLLQGCCSPHGEWPRQATPPYQGPQRAS